MFAKRCQRQLLDCEDGLWSIDVFVAILTQKFQFLFSDFANRFPKLLLTTPVLTSSFCLECLLEHGDSFLEKFAQVNRCFMVFFATI